MTWEQIRGQSPGIEILGRSAARGRLAHALIFAGPPGVGKSLVARTLARVLFCENRPAGSFEACGHCRSCRMMASGSHPDFLTVSCPEGKSEVPIELLVGSRENRGREGLCHDLSLRPMAADWRVAVIEDADRMSTESANALLKTLEEPPPYAVLILIASDATAILPTIRSRCQLVRFSALSDVDVAALLLELGRVESAAEAEEVARLSQGSLAIAEQLLNPELRGLQAQLHSALADPRFRPSVVSQAVQGALERIGGDTQAQRTSAQWIVRFAVDFFRGQLRRWCETTDQLEQPQPAERISEAINRCLDAGEQLGGNASIPLCLESLWDDLGRILGAARVAGAT